VVGNVLIVDWQGVAVLPQGGGRLGVAKALLGLQELAVGNDPTSQWASPPLADGGGLAVLEALDQAQEAFAALPGEPDLADEGEFQHAIMAARRVVLAAPRRCPS
jgi:hypothetical protein